MKSLHDDDGIRFQTQPLAPPLLAGREVFAVPHLALIIDAAAGFGRQVFDPVGERDERPGPIVEIALSGPLGRPAVETPCRVHAIDRAPRAGKFVEPRRGELRPVSRDGRRIGPGERLCRSKARERQTGGGHKGTKDGSHMDDIVVCHAVAGPAGDTGATAAGRIGQSRRAIAGRKTNIAKNSQSGNRRNGIGRIGTGPATGMASDRRKIDRTEELSARRETGSGKNFLTFGPESPRPSRWSERTE